MTALLTMALLANAANRAYAVSLRLDQVPYAIPCPPWQEYGPCRMVGRYIIFKEDRMSVYLRDALPGSKPLIDMRTDDLNLYWPSTVQEEFFQAVIDVTDETEFEKNGKATGAFIQQVAPTIVY